jgi:hypothetical protein
MLAVDEFARGRRHYSLSHYWLFRQVKGNRDGKHASSTLRTSKIKIDQFVMATSDESPARYLPGLLKRSLKYSQRIDRD